MLKHLRRYFLRHNLQSVHRLGELGGEGIPISMASSASPSPRPIDVEPKHPSSALTAGAQTQAENELHQGDRLRHQGQLAAAIAYYRRAVDSNPHWAIAHQRLAEALEQEGHVDEAVAHYRQAVALNAFGSRASGSGAFIPNGIPAPSTASTDYPFAPTLPLSADAEIKLQQVIEACEREQWQEAIAQCETLLAAYPHAAIAYKLWGNALQALGAGEHASEKYQQALRVQPNYAEVYVNLGNLYAQQERWDAAVQHYQQAIALKPDFAGAYRNLAKVWTRQGKSRLAAECWYQALTLEPNTATITQYLTLGNELLQQGQLSQAETCYRRVIELDKTFAGGYFNLAEALAQQGQWQDAAQHYRHAMRLGFANPDLSAAIAPATTSLSANLVATQCYQQAKRQAQQQQWEQAAATLHQGLQRLEPELAQIYDLLGSTLRTNGDYEAAIQCYRKLVLLQPQSAEALANLGSLYAQQQQWQSAIATYHRAIALKPDFAGVHRNLARVWTQVGNARAAAESWYRALSIEPSWASATEHFKLGDMLVRYTQLDWALACYQRAFTLDPTFAQAYYNAAIVLSQQERYDDAIACYQHVVQQVPTHADAYYQLGQILAQRHQWDMSTTYYQQVITLEADQIRGYIGLCESLVQQTRWADAIPVYQKLASLQPSEWRVHHELGDALLQVEHWLGAVAAFHRAIELNPDFIWSHNNLGDALMHLERWSDAVETYRRAIALKDDFHWSHFNLGEALSKLNQWDEAIHSYRNACKLRPDLPLIHDKLRRALEQKIRLYSDEILQSHHQEIALNPDSIQAYYKALEARPKDACLYLKLGQALVKQHQLDQAITFYNIALKINGNDAQAHALLGDALEQKTHSHQAMQAYRRALEIQPDLSNVQARLNALMIDNGTTNTRNGSVSSAAQTVTHGDRLSLRPQGMSASLPFECLPLAPIDMSGDVGSEIGSTVSQIKGWPAHESLLLRSSTVGAPLAPQFEFRRHHTPSAYVVVVPQGGVWVDQNHRTIVTSDGKHISDVGPTPFKLSFVSTQFKQCEYIDGNVVMLLVEQPVNSVNWIFELAAQIELLKICGIYATSIDQFIIHPYSDNLDKALLNSLGIEPQKIYRRSSAQLRAKIVFAPSQISQSAIFSEWICASLRRQFVNTETIKGRSHPKNIYLIQSHPGYHIVNEPELISLLSELGFESIDLSAKPLIEKATYLASAKSIISLQSSELLTVCLCNTGTHLVEILPENNFNDIYWIMSNICHLRHSYITARQVDPSPYMGKPLARQNISVDLARLSQLLQKIRLGSN